MEAQLTTTPLEKEVVLNLYKVRWCQPSVCHMAADGAGGFYHLSRAGMGGCGRAPRELPPAFYNVVRGVVDVVNDRIYGEYK